MIELQQFVHQVAQLPVQVLLGAAAICGLCAILVLADELSGWK